MAKKKSVEMRALEIAVIEIRTIGCCALCCVRESCPGYAKINFKQCDSNLITYFIRKAKEELK